MENCTLVKNFCAFRSSVKAFVLTVALLAGFTYGAYAQLSGSYTIDPNGSGSKNYKTINAALKALSSNGVNGAVTFTLSKDTFNEYVSISSISGASKSNTITFLGTSRTESYILYDTNFASVYMNGADYITFKNLTIDDPNSVGTSVEMENSANYNTFEDCNLYTANAGNSNFQIYIVSSSYNTFNGCLLDGGYYGFYLTGSDNNTFVSNEITNFYYYGFYIDNSSGQYIGENTVTGGYYGVYTYYGDKTIMEDNVLKGNSSMGIYNYYYSDDNIIRHNTITGLGSYGIYMYYSDNVTVDSNYINGASSYGIYAYFSSYTGKIRGNEIASCYYGVYSYYGTHCEYSGNKIYDYGYAGLFLYYANSYSTSDSTMFYNNMIGEGNGGYYGCYVYGCYNVKFVHNSISTSVSNYGIYLSSGSNNDFINNSVAYGGSGYVFYTASTSYLGEMDYNNFHSTGSNYVYFAGSRSSLSALKSASSSYNQNDIDVDPMYVSKWDLHSNSLGLNNMGKNLSQYPTDYDGQTRPVSPDKTVDIGADDYYLAPKDLDIYKFKDFGFDVANNTLSLTLRNAGTDTIPGQTITVGYSGNGGSTWVTQNKTFSDLPIGDTLQITFTTPWKISSAGQYNLCYGITKQITSDPDKSDDTCINICTGYKGIYTIDASGGGDFLSFQDAIDALLCGGIVDSVTFKVATGNYGDVSVPEIVGTSASKRVKFIGNSKSAVISSIDFKGADYITFDNFTIGSSGSTSNEVEFLSNAEHNEVLNSDILMNPNGTSGYGIYEYRSGRYNTVANCNIDGGYMGAYLYGDYSNSSVGVDFTLKNCNMTNQYYYGIYCYYYDAPTIIGNHVSGLRYNTYAYGGLFYYAHDPTIIGNNFEGGGYGLLIGYANYPSYWSSPSSNSQVYNNFASATGNYYGLYFYYCYYVDLYHNSTNAATGSYGVYMYNPNYCNIKNNIFVQQNSGYGIYFYAGSSVTFDNNLIYSGQGSEVYYANTGGVYTSPSSFYSASGYCASCQMGDPGYTSNTDLHTTDLLPNNNGDNKVGISVDIDGDTRPYSPDTVVDIGADEYYLAPYDLDVVQILDPAVPVLGNNLLSAVIRNRGTKSVSSQSLKFGYQIAGGSWYDTTITIPKTSPGDTFVIRFPKPFNVSTSKDIEICVRINPQLSNDPDKEDKWCDTRCVGKAGNYTISAKGNGDFKTFAEALKAISCGVSGPVVITVDTGTYKEQVYLTNLPGMSATNTVTFKGVGAKQVKVTYAGSSYSDWGTFELDGADYFVISNMTIENTASTYACGVHLHDEADYNKIDNCTITLPNNSSSAAACIAGVSTSGSYGDNANYNIISNCDMSNYYYGVRFYGSSSSDFCEGNQFINNTVNVTYYTFYMYYQSEIKEYNNTLNGYYLYNYYCSNFDIRNNRHNGYYSYLYYPNYANYNSNIQSYYVNNVLNLQYYAYFYYAYNVNIWHNTIVSPYTSVWIYFYYNSNTDVRNNIFVNTGGGYIYMYSSTFADLDHNVYYTTGGNLVYWTGTYYSSVATLNAGTGWEDHGYEELPAFVNLSGGDYHLSNKAKKYEGDIVGIKYDYDGDARCPYSPTCGMDEGQFVYPAPSANFIYPDSVFINSPVTFEAVAAKGTQEEYKWYLNGTLVSSYDTFTTTFNKTGYDTIALRVENCGGIDSVAIVLNVKVPSGPPVIDFAADKYFVGQYDTVRLFDYSNNGPTSWKWEITPVYNSLGSPNFNFVNGDYVKNPIVEFWEPGTYTVCLTAENSVGKSNKVCKTAYIKVLQTNDMCLTSGSKISSGTLYDDLGSYDGYSPNVNCSFLIDPCGGEIDLEFTKFDINKDDYVRIYDGNNSNGKPLWDVATYGVKGMTDDNLSNPNFISKYKAKSGRVYVEFETDNADLGGKGFALTWNAKQAGGTFTPPVASFDYPDTICKGIRTYFQNTSTGSYNTYEWYEDNSAFPVLTEDYSVIFPDTGNYDITLKAINCGGRDSITKTVTVVTPKGGVQPGFYADNLKPEVAIDIVNLMDTTKGCIDKYEWTFSPNKVAYVNNTTNNSKNPQVVFFGTGCIDVTLTVTDALGNQKSLTKKCYIVPFGYCTPKVSTLNPDIGISLVKFGDINNSSNAGVSRFTDYSASQSTGVEVGGSYPITIERSTNYNKANLAVWIDFNIDGDFDDSAEMVLASGASLNLSWMDTIQIPNSAQVGKTKMRVGISYSNQSNTPCGPNRYGEFEDYSVIISPDATKPELTVRYKPGTVWMGLNEGDTLSLERCHTMSMLNIDAQAYDIASGNLVVNIDSSNVDVSTVGVYPVTFSATDASNNVVTMTIYIDVTEDMTPPDIQLVGKQMDTISVYATYSDLGYVASDNCSGIKNVVVTSTIDTANVGTYTITYTAYDNAGNSSSVSRQVFVADMEAPTVTITSDTLVVDVNTEFKFPEAAFPVIDNYYSASEVSITLSGKFVDDFPGYKPTILGDYPLEVSWMDGSGNKFDTTLVIRVVDRVAPVITLVNPTDKMVEIKRFQEWDYMSTYTLKDNYYDSASINVSYAGSYIDSYMVYKDFGVYEINYTAEDGSGNVSTITRYVYVNGLTSISEGDGVLSGISIYPNPTDGIFNITVQMKHSERVRISILNVLGDQVQSVADEDVVMGNYEVDLSKASAGVYFVRLETSGMTKMYRLVLTK